MLQSLPTLHFLGAKMNILSVGMYGPPDVFNRCPSTELSLEAQSRQNSVSHCKRTGARGQFKIVSFSQEWFFPEASCCFNLKKAASSSILIWALCLHTPYLFAALLSPQLYISQPFSWIFPFPPFFLSLWNLCCGSESACMPGDLSQLHPKPVPGWGASVLSLFPQKGPVPWSLKWTDVDSSTTRTVRHAIWT